MGGVANGCSMTVAEEEEELLSFVNEVVIILFKKLVEVVGVGTTVASFKVVVVVGIGGKGGGI